MKLVLIHIILDEGVKLKLPPLVFLFERLDNFYLFLCPFGLDFPSLCYVGVTVRGVSLVRKLIEFAVVKRHLPYASVEYSGTVRYLCYSAG